jgi:hypothetical protein
MAAASSAAGIRAGLGQGLLQLQGNHVHPTLVKVKRGSGTPNGTHTEPLAPRRDRITQYKAEEGQEQIDTEERDATAPKHNPDVAENTLSRLATCDLAMGTSAVPHPTQPDTVRVTTLPDTCPI